MPPKIEPLVTTIFERTKTEERGTNNVTYIISLALASNQSSSIFLSWQEQQQHHGH